MEATASCRLIFLAGQMCSSFQLYFKRVRRRCYLALFSCFIVLLCHCFIVLLCFVVLLCFTVSLCLIVQTEKKLRKELCWLDMIHLTLDMIHWRMSATLRALGLDASRIEDLERPKRELENLLSVVTQK